jgi:alpha/beta superfamily hydrolase
VAQAESFDMAGPAGRLEAILMHPEGEPVAAAVVCHAHPLHGGIMHFKVVFRAAKALQQRGIAALRFNFRGVGRSEGVHADGVGEQDDARTALDEVARRFPGLPLLLGGFSFGSVVASRVAAAHPVVAGLFILGFPLSMLESLAYLETIRVPRLFVLGENDTYGSGAAVKDLALRLPGPASVVVVPEADHFFAGHLDQLHESVASWAATRPWQVA